MSKKINAILFVALLALLVAPFFQIEASEGSYTYINAFSLMPFGSSESNFGVIYNELGSVMNLLFIIFPILGIVAMVGSIITDKVAYEILAYVVAFIGFCFSVFSVHGFEQYDLSFGYFGTVFVYVLIFAIKIIDYLVSVSDNEEKIWGSAKTK